jgi:molybdate transport system substrate-binding protein
VAGTINVYAAASLTKAFTEIAVSFQTAHPGTSVRLNFNGSSTLVTQIFQGAPADVFASADTENMDRLVSSGLMAGTPQVFTKNRLRIVVAKGNPKGIVGLTDLARGDVITVLCAPAVPCGNYARQILTTAGVTVAPKSNESSVTAVIGRVATGEADAGIVYVTDVLADSRVSGVTIPDAANVIAEYPLAVLRDASNAPTAQAFVELVRSSAGQTILGKYGFLPL